ncbi:hypothetical protein V7S43_007603 [Phytophthora oleae]|uniref:Uncharacterized protein n=1 Tax=Phytophthora oleae TaxID=2107226 RepID=A0ABD3FLU5_9STRA
MGTVLTTAALHVTLVTRMLWERMEDGKVQMRAARWRLAKAWRGGLRGNGTTNPHEDLKVPHDDAA